MKSKMKMSKSKKINPNKSMLGKHHSEETKMKMSKSAKGRKLNEDTRKKLSDFMKGKRMVIVNGKRTWK